MIYLKCSQKKIMIKSSQKPKMLTKKIMPGKGKEHLLKYSQTKADGVHHH